MNKSKYILPVVLVLIGLGLLNFGQTARAALVTCGTTENSQACTICDLIALVKRIIDFVLFELAPAVAVFLYLLAGFTILLGGTPLKIQGGKTIFWNTTIGLIIMFSAWMIANTILKSLATDDVSDKWYQIECKEPAGIGIPVSPTQKYSCNNNNQCVADPNGQYSNSNCDGKCPPPVVAGGGICDQTSCQPDGLSCEPVNPGDGCSASRVNTYNQDIAVGAGNISICPGVDTQKLLKAIIANETGGFTNRVSFDGSSFGLFQIKPDTANQNKYKNACGVAENIDSNWLKRRDTVTKQACIAANILKDSASSCGCDVRQLAAGYNGGSQGACDVSANCGPSAGGGQCSMCSNQSGPTKRWECLWDDNQHNTCNSSRPDGGFSQTRFYVPRVEYCYKNVFGGGGSANIAITTNSLADLSAGQDYNQQLSATGGSNYVWSLKSGSHLPAGLTLNPGGSITGKSQNSGDYKFTVAALDTSGAKAEKELTLKIKPAALAACTKVAGTGNINFVLIPADGIAITPGERCASTWTDNDIKNGKWQSTAEKFSAVLDAFPPITSDKFSFYRSDLVNNNTCRSGSRPTKVEINVYNCEFRTFTLNRTGTVNIPFGGDYGTPTALAHELGHSFSLEDEYYEIEDVGYDLAPRTGLNCVAAVCPSGWKQLGVSCYEGCGYKSTGVFRDAENDLMKCAAAECSNNQFGPIDKKVIESQIK